ncbi:hypothetical protein tb265_47100 [Gemmatimonadetes bacterium T265]|nr:hypothetical protein tb265_47100 [Gemmatimonadetes bacterium T265]
MTPLAARVFALSPDVRYVATYVDGRLDLAARAAPNASAAESDRYEELLVNPTLLTLAGQRGRIDCGGLEYVLVRYGHFFQLVVPIRGGHISVAVEPSGAPLDLVDGVRAAAAADPVM